MILPLLSSSMDNWKQLLDYVWKSEKKIFITMMKEKVKEHGQQTFYAIKESDGTVVDIFEHSDCFKFETVLAEFYCQADENNLNFEAFEAFDQNE